MKKFATQVSYATILPKKFFYKNKLHYGKINMLPISNIQSINDWLKQAAHFNQLWHQYQDFLEHQQFSSNLEQQLYEQHCSMFRHQKNLCQISALRLAYSYALENQPYSLSLQLDLAEGDNIYLLHNPQLPNCGCHIPYRVLIQYLTQTELQFFHIY